MVRTKQRKKKNSKFNNFVALPRKMIRSEEWKKLSLPAREFYLQLKAKYNGRNNGEIKLHYSEFKGNRGISSASTISKAILELEVKGWIERTRFGGLHRYSNLFKLTGNYDDHLRF